MPAATVGAAYSETGLREKGEDPYDDSRSYIKLLTDLSGLNSKRLERRASQPDLERKTNDSLEK